MVIKGFEAQQVSRKKYDNESIWNQPLPPEDNLPQGVTRSGGAGAYCPDPREVLQRQRGEMAG